VVFLGFLGGFFIANPKVNYWVLEIQKLCTARNDSSRIRRLKNQREQTISKPPREKKPSELESNQSVNHQEKKN
jgi:hypothetical protein